MSLLEVAGEVRAAQQAGQPVLALESTIITHGLPQPLNLELAQAAEDEARASGAVPATIAVLDGRLRVGLGPGELERVARLGEGAAKCSRRDIPILVATGGSGGTTVAATMAIAALAGIRVMATGGIGGVHRGAEDSLDISADLQELARTPVAVVCAGPKAILDLGRTLEYLETHGVPVIGHGCDELPAFWCRESGHSLVARLDSAQAIAEVLRSKWGLGLGGGVVIANPIPMEHALPGAVVAKAITAALAVAARQGVSGAQLTPCLLREVERSTGGASLAANRALLLNNVRLGAQVAKALA